VASCARMVHGAQSRSVSVLTLTWRAVRHWFVVHRVDL